MAASCDEPRTGQTSSDGRVVLQVPAGSQGFAGYFEITRPDDVLNLVFAAPPISGDVADYTRSYWGGEDLAQLAALAGVVRLDGLGSVVLATTDCRGAGSAGVGITVSMSPSPAQAAIAYTHQEGGGVTLTTIARSTDLTGGAAIFNVPEGRYELEGRLPTGRVMGRTSLHVRRGAISTLTLGPLK